jgi:hypothetical protein
VPRARTSRSQHRWEHVPSGSRPALLPSGPRPPPVPRARSKALGTDGYRRYHVGLVLPLCRELDLLLSVQIATGAAKWAPPSLCAESNGSGPRHRGRTGPTSQCLHLHYTVAHTHNTHATLSTRSRQSSPARRAAPARRTLPARRAAPARRTSPTRASAPLAPALPCAPCPPLPRRLALPPAVILLGTGKPSSSSAPARRRPVPPVLCPLAAAVLRPLVAVAVGEAAASSS